ncbi:TonB-dependent receptor [soil metagenome]
MQGMILLRAQCMSVIGIIAILLALQLSAAAQHERHPQDSTAQVHYLDSVLVTGYWRQNYPQPLPVVKGTFLMGGKKSEEINLTQLPADITNKTGRQLFAKIPGVFVYDMDGAGNQVNIAARGLDPHRGWEFNLRKDGIITNSDMYGYPASHYSMPLESIERIELVHGTGSLQYGAQFGGMLNYVSKQGDSTRKFSFESYNTVGSFNLLSTYSAIGGKVGKLRYYAYMQKKSRGGYRENEHTDSEAEGVVLNYEAAPGLSIRAEWARSKYLYRIPGALTDSMFHADPTQATRSRNYFSPDIHVPSININWELAAQTKLQLVTSAVIGKRNSVMFDKPTNVMDTIVIATMQYNNRQVDIDRFNSYTSELRILQEYKAGNQQSMLTAGLQYMNNDLHRTQLGKGTTASDYDLSLVQPGWGRDVHLKTHNLAIFAENKFQLLKNLFVNVGTRIEMGQTNMTGTIAYYPENKLPVTIKHSFPLLGANFSYKPGKNKEVYGGFSQAYRPMLFKDLIPASLYEKVDPDIKDSKGYNAELGFRGNWRLLKWDVTGFLLDYQNRFGTLALTDNQGVFYTYRTNIGNSLTKGIEAFAQADWMLSKKVMLSIFTSTAYMQARYTDAAVKSGTTNVSLRGNNVESAPDLTSRNGATIRYGKFSYSLQYSYTSSSFADPLNTVEPAKTTGAVGLVPSYGLLDMNASFRFSKTFELKAILNNVTNKQYFTKRPTFYPGPGVWPSEGRGGSVSLVVRI